MEYVKVNNTNSAFQEKQFLNNKITCQQICWGKQISRHRRTYYYDDLLPTSLSTVICMAIKLGMLHHVYKGKDIDGMSLHTTAEKSAVCLYTSMSDLLQSTHW